MTKIWNTMDTAPRNGTWFIALRAVTLIGAGNPPRAIPEMLILQRKSISGDPSHGGFWSSSYGNSVPDIYIEKGLWAPLDAIPLDRLYSEAAARGETPFPLSDRPDGDRWIDHHSRTLKAIGDQEFKPSAE
ncbi:hypothetical protein RJJ65_32375 [Rhizobium hidalgonense]|uniref:Uncharacterized protein n=1 Tax=Rhizobium hidalgonense TaxID=1538159 RepID=A0AAJ2LQT5_9HYPH|nr:hypothetical protein [Rhizobium hidalgonense]MDR9777256.1 hypothetical protein [Rhizobium hidalgonense]